MATYYLDTSALVKLYVVEPGTDRLLQLAARARENRFVILALSPIETRAAIRRRERAGDIARKTADLILERLRQHLEGIFLVQTLNDAVLDGAIELIDRYALRAYDALQLAGCITCGRLGSDQRAIFVCSDRQLLAAAKSELLEVLDPSTPE